MSRKGENIYKRKDGRWEARYVKGHEGRKTIYGYIYTKTYADARKQLTLKRAEIVTGENNPPKKVQNEITFTLVSEMWLQSVKPAVKDSTWIKYRNILKNNVVPFIGDNKINSVDYSAVTSLCTDLLQSGGKQHGLSSKTVSDALTIVKSVIKYALRMNYSSNNSALDVSIKSKAGNLRVLSLYEEKLLIAHITADMNPTNLGILISLFTGIRIGELCALTWDDIDLGLNVMHIRRTMQRIQIPDGDKKTTIQITEPKSQCSIRDVPIAACLREYLLRQKKEGFILSGSNKYIEPRTMQNRFAAIMKECNITDAHFHTLRHTFATRCIEAGFDVKSLSEILGHANVSITLNRYVHPSMEMKQKNIDLLSGLLTVG